MLSASLRIVATRSTVGKAENSSGFWIHNATIRISTESAIDSARPKSIMTAGTGRKNRQRIRTMPTAKAMSLPPRFAAGAVPTAVNDIAALADEAPHGGAPAAGECAANLARGSNRGAPSGRPTCRDGGCQLPELVACRERDTIPTLGDPHELPHPRACRQDRAAHDLLSFLRRPERATPIIFLHGWPELSIAWRGQLPAFRGLGLLRHFARHARLRTLERLSAPRGLRAGRQSSPTWSSS